MKNILLFILLHIASLSYSSNEQKDSLCFQILISDGFNNDTVDFSFNTILLLNEVILTSHPTLGTTGVYMNGYKSSRKYFLIQQYNNSLCINSRKIRKRKLQLVSVKYNGQNFRFEMDLNEGKYLLITKNVYSNTIVFYQSKVELGFD